MDNYDPKYLFWGFHVRKLATCLAIFFIIVSILSLPSGYVSPLIAHLPYAEYFVYSFVVYNVLCIAAWACVIVADTKRKSVFYLPVIVLSVMGIIGLIFVTGGTFVLTIVASVKAYRNEAPEHSGWYFFGMYVVLMLTTCIGCVICHITIRAYRYMVDEIETKVIPA